CRPATGLLLTIVKPIVADALGCTGPNIAPSGSTASPFGKSNCNEPDTGSANVFSKMNVTVRRSRAPDLTTTGVAFTIIGTSDRDSSALSRRVVGGLPKRRPPSLMLAVASLPFNVTGPLTQGSFNPIQSPR